jgi:hypothetical protein
MNGSERWLPGGMTCWGASGRLWRAEWDFRFTARRAGVHDVITTAWAPRTGRAPEVGVSGIELPASMGMKVNSTKVSSAASRGVSDGLE